MNKDIVKLWSKNKKHLKEYFSSQTEDLRLCYKDLVRIIVKEVLNNHDEIKKYDMEHIYEIDNGDCEGTLVFLIPRDISCPGCKDYLVTCIGYGSCSGCDTLMFLNEGENYKDRVKDYMTLCLHLIQNMKPLY